MRKLAILPLAFALGACSSFSWSGQNSNLSDEDRSLGLKDVATLSLVCAQLAAVMARCTSLAKAVESCSRRAV